MCHWPYSRRESAPMPSSAQETVGAGLAASSSSVGRLGRGTGELAALLVLRPLQPRPRPHPRPRDADGCTAPTLPLWVALALAAASDLNTSNWLCCCVSHNWASDAALLLVSCPEVSGFDEAAASTATLRVGGLASGDGANTRFGGNANTRFSDVGNDCSETGVSSSPELLPSNAANKRPAMGQLDAREHWKRDAGSKTTLEIGRTFSETAADLWLKK